MAAGDLTTLAHVKAWLNITNDASDALLQRMITASSKAILNYINRSSLAATTYQDIVDGYGNSWMLIRQWPVISVQSIQFQGMSIVSNVTGQNPPGVTPGYILESPDSISGGQQRLTLVGSWFPRGKSNIIMNYTAGYQQTEQVSPVASDPVGSYSAPVVTSSVWLADAGVIYTNSLIPLVKVAANPTAGQYSVSNAGVYIFSNDDVGADLTITYSFVPADLEEACWELVADRYVNKDRIGINSKTLGGQETIVYSKSSFSDVVKSLLGPYMRVTPT